MLLMLFLWYVSVLDVFPVRRSQKRTVLSYDPVITCGSADCDRMDATVLSWPDRQYTWALVRMSWRRRRGRGSRGDTGEVESAVLRFASLSASL